MAHLKKNWRFYLWLAFLGSLMLLGVLAFYLDRTQELSDMSDLVPWGLGIIVDVSSVGLAACSFTLALLVYVLGRQEFKPLLRVATLIGLIAYTSAGLVLLTDLGRPDRFWHIIVFQNPRSVLTLVSWCLMSYMGVLGLQMIPVLCDWPLLTDRWPFLERIPGALHKVMPALALLGTFIGVTHQAAAGAAFGIVKARAVWYRPTITIVFIISAIFASLAFMLMVVTLTERVMGLRRQLVERELLINVGRIAAAIAIIGLFVRLAELAFTSYYSPLPFYKEQIDVLTTETPYALGVVVGEVVLGSIIPIIILLSPMNRKGRNLMLAGLLATFGLLLNRWSTALSGLVATTFYALNNPQITWNAYFPSWVEWLMVLGVVAYALLAYTLGVRLLPIFQPLEETVDPQITSQATVS